MEALVLMSVGNGGRAKERQAKDVAGAGVAVLAVVQQSHSVSELAQIGILVTDDLELGPLPGSVPRRWTLTEAELILVGRELGCDAERNLPLEESGLDEA